MWDDEEYDMIQFQAKAFLRAAHLRVYLLIRTKLIVKTNSKQPQNVNKGPFPMAL